MKKIFIACLILILFFSFTIVSASDVNDTVITLENQNNPNDSINIDNNMFEESEIDYVNETNNYHDSNENYFSQNEVLLLSSEGSNILKDDPDWTYVSDASTKGFGENIPIYIANSATGFVLKDGQFNYQRFFTKHSDGNYYPDCYAEDYLLPGTFKLGDDTYLLTNGPGDVWYYKKVSYTQPKQSSIIVNDYDFINYQYPSIGSGEQYSSVSIPVQVLNSNGNGANGAIIVTDSLGNQVGTAHVTNGYTRVSVSLTQSGRSKYDIQFNSIDNTVSSTSTSFYITARDQEVSVFIEGINDGDEVTLKAGTTTRLNITTWGATSGALLFRWFDSNGKPLSSADADNPVYQINSWYHYNCLVNVPELEGNYKLSIIYGFGSALHDFDGKAKCSFNVHVILNMRLGYDSNITTKIGSSLNLNISVEENVRKNPNLQTDDPIEILRNYIWTPVTGGYVSTVIHDNEYQFPVVNGVANINLYVDGYIGNPTFNYKRGVGFDSPISINFNYIPCDIELIYDNPIITNSDSTFCSDIEVLADGYHINGGTLILDIIDKQTGNISKSYTSKVSYGKATFNITVPEVIHDYNYRIRYTGFPAKNNTEMYLNVYDYREYSLKSYLLDENNNNISLITGKYSGNSTFKIKVTDNLNEVNNNLVKLIIGSDEYMSAINNNEANFNFKNEFYDKDCILMYYIVDGIEFFVKSIPYNVVEKDVVISLNETDIISEFSTIKNVEINVIDEFGNPLNGYIKSKFFNSQIIINNGKGILTIENIPIGYCTDILMFESKGCKITNYTYSFEITKEILNFNIENNELEVKIGDFGNDLIAFNITNKNNDEFIALDSLNVNDNNFTIISSSVGGKYFLKVPDKVGIYNLTISSNDDYYIVYDNFLINITKIKPNLHMSQRCIVTRNEALVDFYYLNNNINDLIDGNITISINNKTMSYKYEGHDIILDLPHECGTYAGIVKFEGSDICLPIEQEFNITTVKSECYFDFVGPTNVSVTSNKFEISGYLYLFTYENINEFEDIKIIINNKTYNVNGYYKGRMSNSMDFIRFYCELDTKDFFTAEELFIKNNKSIDGKLVFQGNNFINAAPDKEFNVVLYKSSQKISIPDVKSKLGDDISIAGSFDRVLSEFNNSGKVKLLIDDNLEFEFDVDDYQFNKSLPFNLNIGTHKCIATFYHSDIFIDCNTTFKINIYEPEAIISLNNTNISADFNTNISVPVYVQDIFGNPLNGTILSSKYHEEFTIINGRGILKIIAPDYSIGDFDDSLIFVSNKTSTTEFKYTFHLLKREGLIYLDKYEVNVGESNKIPFNICDKYNTPLDSIYTLNVENKEFSISSNNLIIPNKPGDYNLSINGISSSEYYKNFTTNILFKINKICPSLSIVDECNMGRNKHIYIELDGSDFDVVGNVTVILNDCEYSFYYDKSPEYLLVSLPDQIGKYNGYLKYFGSEYFEPVEENFTVNVDKRSTSIELTSSSEINSEIITISGYLNCDDSLFKDLNNIKLFIENNQYPVQIISKVYDRISFKSTVNISGILSSKINGKVVFEETDYLKSSSYEFNLYLTKQTQKLNIPNIVVELGKDIDIVGVFENIREGFKNDGEIYIDVTNDYKTFRIATNGNYTIMKTIPPFYSVGTYKCCAKFYNSKLFNDCETWFNITVTQPKDYSVNITTNVVVKDDNYLNGADINIKLSQNIDVKANVILNNQKVSTINIVAGVGNTHVNNLIVGENTVKIELDDKDYHGLCTETFDAHEILSDDKIDIKLPETNSNDNSIVVNLPKDAQGEVILKINNQEYKFKVENGVSNVKLPDLKNGNYDYTITYSGDGKYSSFTKSNNLVVNKVLKTTIVANDISVVYKSNKYVDISLKDSEGKPVANVDIRININGETTTLSLDSFGTTSYSTELLKPKTYTATITFGGNKKYDKSTATVKVTVKKATPKITAKAKTFKKSVKTKKYTITLKTNQNKVMKNTKVTIKVNKKTYSAKTNSKGVATFKITKLTKKGTFKSIITYKGDKYYNKVTKIVNIKVK